MAFSFLHSGIKNQSGSAAVATALCMTVLVVVLGFVLDTGYLYSEKNRRQNAVEAAAMAGAIDLCGKDPAGTVRRIAAANGIEGANDETVLTVEIGFYDEHDTYAESFSTFRDFEADPLPETSANEAVERPGGTFQYNNAVRVHLNQPVQRLTGGLTGDGSVPMQTAAVAFLARYDIIAGEEGLTVNPGFANGYPQFQATTIHANGDLTFSGRETFVEEAPITATGQVSGCNAPHRAGVAEVELKPLDHVMEELRDKAEREGTLIDMSAWPADDTWHEAPFGHRMRRSSAPMASIELDNGDHGGAVYFFAAGEGSEAIQTVYFSHHDLSSNAPRAARNFNLATDASQLNFQLSMPLFPSITLGGEGEEAASFYASGEILFNPFYNSWSPFNYLCEGVFFRSSVFRHRWYRRGGAELKAQKMRIIADEIIYQGSQNADPLFDALYGPPCPPRFVRLGRLEATDG